MTKKNPSVGILGAGVTGLSIAFALAEKNIAVSIYEKSDEPGGAIRTVRKDGWLIEEGPNTLMVKSRVVWDLLNKLELKPELLEANKAAEKRFVVKKKKPIAVPSSPGGILTTPLFSAGAKLRLLKEPLVPASARDDESIATFIRRRLGNQPLDYGVNPFISGIYAGDPKSLSVKHTFSSLWEMEQNHGSLTKGLFKKERADSSARKALVSFQGGNQTLPKALARNLKGDIHLSTAITSVEKNDGRWMVHAVTENNEFQASHDCLISTLPAYTLPGIFKWELFEELAEIPYAPISVMALGFKKEMVSHPLDGFGMLVPEVEQYKLLGCLFSSTLFPGRAPDDHHLLTCFIGGARNPEMASNPTDKLLSTVTGELDELLGISGNPVFLHHKFWPKAIPQYIVGYDHYLSLMKEIENQNPGLFLDGNFRDGVSVPDCITSGFETGQKVHDFLNSR